MSASPNSRPSLLASMCGSVATARVGYADYANHALKGDVTTASPRARAQFTEVPVAGGRGSEPGDLAIGESS